ncbi:NUDIX hydrolase [Hazenella coriacea]|nr:NUDIX hydrolase [Hazenella coriacea]
MTSPKQRVNAYVVVLNRNSEILLVKQNNRSWDLPGGSVKGRESIRIAALRTVKEQTGLQIKLVQFCGIFQNVNAGITHILFIAKPIGGQLLETTESLDVGFFPIKPALRFTIWKNVKQRILYCLDESKQPFFVEF